ncbi:hypothetical protein ITJ38_11920 [Agreia pratensis]|uniref:Lipoprotein n=1 Tax=Agreia pratensis TaxID=150121 RepID=A0A1X7JC16_9MICO|nr:hypothetical protein [Agreia pratensis]MBF4635113.1 hypothetical protein [Agreia pratensis]SMG25274.1 hypothetical protein SAMN06296010_1241 [Agreia pratensis]
MTQPSRIRNRRTATTLAAVVLVSLLSLTGCVNTVRDVAIGMRDGGRPSPEITPAPKRTGNRPSPTPPPVSPPPAGSTPAPTFDPSDFDATLSAGTVADGAPASLSGSGSAIVNFELDPALMVVVDLDCSACTGEVVVSAPTRKNPLGTSQAPLTASYLNAVLDDDSPSQGITVKATGSWNLKITTSGDYPTVSGTQSGSGPRVLNFSDSASHIAVDYTPLDGADSLFLRVFPLSGHTKIFGNDDALVETLDADVPGIVAVSTNGSWTLTPTP